MLARIRKSLENRAGDAAGFTLIELLVVMVIIGILAAIAIPSFLAQRDKGYQSAEKSDLKTTSLSEQAYAADNNGAFTADSGLTSASTTTSDTAGLVAQGEKVSANDTVSVKLYTSTGGVTNDSYKACVTSSSTKAIYILDSVNDVPVKQPATTTACP